MSTHPPRLGRRRRENEPGGRQHFHKVKVSVDEEAALQALAAQLHVTVPRLLVESALAPGGETAADRRNVAAELLATRQLVAAMSNNINQIARQVNSTGEVPANLAATVGAARDLMRRLDEAALKVMRP